VSIRALTGCNEILLQDAMSIKTHNVSLSFWIWSLNIGLGALQKLLTHILSMVVQVNIFRFDLRLTANSQQKTVYKDER